jgi:antitoxin (DNA-binding transcriptional repressor) of toxin-antitoxin stability system
MAQARARLAELLNAAELGKAVVIERRGVRFTLTIEPTRCKAAAAREMIEYIDPAVLEGDWTWTWGRRGLNFSKRRARR